MGVTVLEAFLLGQLLPVNVEKPGQFVRIRCLLFTPEEEELQQQLGENADEDEHFGNDPEETVG
jgi:hypothetical protein